MTQQKENGGIKIPALAEANCGSDSEPDVPEPWR